MIKNICKAFISSQILIVVLFCLVRVLNLPDELTVNLETSSLVGMQIGYQDETGKVIYDRERPFGGYDGAAVTKIVLSTGHTIDEMAWGFRNGPCEVKFSSIHIKKWLILPFELTPKEIMDYYVPTEGMSASVSADGSLVVSLKTDSAYFVPRKDKQMCLTFSPDKTFVIGTLILEIILLMMAIIATLFKLPNEKCSWRTFCVQAGLIALLTSLFFCVVVPFQSYLVNRETWPFTCMELFREVVVYFALFTIGLFGVFSILKPSFARVFLVLTWGIVLYCYLEIGFLSIGLPILNGNVSFFVYNRFRGNWDLAILALSVVGSVVAYRWIRHWLHWLSIGLAIMVIASLFDVRVEEGIPKNNSLMDEFCSSEDLLESAYFSKTNNNIMFILDTTTTEVVLDALDQDAGIAEAFQGFTIYTNNIGMHHATNFGIPGITLGSYLDIGTKMRGYEASFASKDSFFAPYLAEKVPTFFMFGLTRPYNWSSEKKEGHGERPYELNTSILRPTMRRTSGLFAWNLFEVVRFRLTPFKFKFYSYLMTIKDWPLYEKGAVEHALFPRLAKLPIKDDVKQTLHVYHTQGTHAPFLTDRYGRKLPTPSHGYKGSLEKALFVLTSMADLLRTLKDREIYDNSFIVITADHGAHCSKNPNIIRNGIELDSSIAFPVLMVKPVGARGFVSKNEIPTSHSKISALMKRAMSEKIDIAAVNDILHEDIRLFRHFKDHAKIHYDWIFKADGSITCEEHRE